MTPKTSGTQYQWPEWPRDQLSLFDMDIETERDDRDSENALSRGGRVREKKTEIDKRGQVECPKCHEMKTAGLPCPCKEKSN